MKSFYNLTRRASKLAVLAAFSSTLFAINDVSFAKEVKLLYTTEPTNDTTVVITPKQSRIFYVGMNNPITITVKGVDLKKIKVSTDNGFIRGQNGEYNVSPKRWGNVTITVSTSGKIIHKEAFRVKLIPSPIACVTGLQRKSAATKEQLQEAGGLSVYMPGFSGAYTISKFSMTSSFGSVVSNSDKFTDEQLKIIQKTTVGKTLYFSDIHAIGVDGTTRKLSTFKITLK